MRAGDRALDQRERDDDEQQEVGHDAADRQVGRETHLQQRRDRGPRRWSARTLFIIHHLPVCVCGDGADEDQHLLEAVQDRPTESDVMSWYRLDGGLVTLVTSPTSSPLG